MPDSPATTEARYARVYILLGAFCSYTRLPPWSARGLIDLVIVGALIRRVGRARP